MIIFFRFATIKKRPTVKWFRQLVRVLDVRIDIYVVGMNVDDRVRKCVLLYFTSGVNFYLFVFNNGHKVRMKR